jgi:steroid delta-isomerase-like uncharacterized protein
VSQKASGSEATNADLIRRYMEEAFNQGDLAKFDEFFATDFVDHDGSPNQQPGPLGVKAAYAQWREAFPDTHVTIDDLVAAGEKVVLRSTLRATHQGAAMGLPATGKPISIRAISIFRVAGGEIVERWGLIDALGLLRQLGAAPPA